MSSKNIGDLVSILVDLKVEQRDTKNAILQILQEIKTIKEDIGSALQEEDSHRDSSTMEEETAEEPEVVQPYQGSSKKAKLSQTILK